MPQKLTRERLEEIKKRKDNSSYAGGAIEFGKMIDDLIAHADTTIDGPEIVAVDPMARADIATALFLQEVRYANEFVMAGKLSSMPGYDGIAKKAISLADALLLELQSAVRKSPPQTEV